jgi:CheY-like chemotaxis protein
MNLVSNAAESQVESGGEIKVSTGAAQLSAAEAQSLTVGATLQPGLHVYCEVRDSGGGMTHETMFRIFEPFYTTREMGRGLGLAASLGIVRAHRGAFRVTSAPGRGTTVRLWLPPAAGVLNESIAEAGPVTGEVRGCTVLIVDDDARVRAMAESMLRRLGCRVLSAADGYEAVKIFSQRHDEINVVMLDYTMPGLDGFATGQRLRVIRPDVRLLIASGHDEEGVRNRTGDLGGCGFVAKPYTLHLLRQSLGRALHG